MGKGQHQMSTREELITKHNRLNIMGQVRLSLTFINPLHRYSIRTSSAAFPPSFFTVLVSGTAGEKQVSAKPKSKLHCIMWRWIIRQHSVMKDHSLIMLHLTGLLVCLNSDYLQTPSETWEHLGLPSVRPCVHTFPLCVSKTSSCGSSICLLAQSKKNK